MAYNTTNLRVLCDFANAGRDRKQSDLSDPAYAPVDATTVEVTSTQQLQNGDLLDVTSITGNLDTGTYEVSTVTNTTFRLINVTFTGGPSGGTLDWEHADNANGNTFGSGQNWWASSTATGDFDVQNVNSAFVEQVWRSAVLGSLSLRCDTELGGGVLLNTFAIINHNFQLGGGTTVTLKGTNDATWGSFPFSVTLDIPEVENLYYIADTAPVTAYRYWEIDISDSSNPDGYIQIGAIVFGAAENLDGECFVDQIELQEVDYADVVRTEGYSNVANSRIQQRRLGLEFRSLELGAGNYEILQDVFLEARTTLKCLWIPTPTPAPATPLNPDGQALIHRYAVFAKMAQVPLETHNNKGPDLTYVSFNIDLDESL